MATKEQIAANEGLQAILALQKCAGFEWFMSKLAGISDDLADAALHDERKTPEQREASRQRHLQMLEVLELPAVTLRSAEQVLKGISVNDGTPPE